MKHLITVFATLALTLPAQAKGSAVEQLLNNLNKFEAVQHPDGEAIDGTAVALVAEALTQADIRVTGECEYIGRSFLQKCKVAITPLQHADENGFNKFYIFKFESLHGVSTSPLFVNFLL